jgi:hypothetical protein
VREWGDVRPKSLGGDRKSGRVDTHEAAIAEAPVWKRTVRSSKFDNVLREQRG